MRITKVGALSFDLWNLEFVQIHAILDCFKVGLNHVVYYIILKSSSNNETISASSMSLFNSVSVHTLK